MAKKIELAEPEKRILDLISKDIQIIGFCGKLFKIMIVLYILLLFSNAIDVLLKIIFGFYVVTGLLFTIAVQKVTKARIPQYWLLCFYLYELINLLAEYDSLKPYREKNKTLILEKIQEVQKVDRWLIKRYSDYPLVGKSTIESLIDLDDALERLYGFIESRLEYQSDEIIHKLFESYGEIFNQLIKKKEVNFAKLSELSKSTITLLKGQRITESEGFILKLDYLYKRSKWPNVIALILKTLWNLKEKIPLDARKIIKKLILGILYITAFLTLFVFFHWISWAVFNYLNIDFGDLKKYISIGELAICAFLVFGILLIGQQKGGDL